MAIFPVFYAGNIEYYRRLARSEDVRFELFEHFPKQTYRNRMEILGPNGVQKLVIPTGKTGQRRVVKDVSISYAENWQKDHWKSLEAAYRRSPYFEFYEDRLRPLYTRKTKFLVAFNLELHALICSLLELDVPHAFTTNYTDAPGLDHRNDDFEAPGLVERPYLQVFSDRQPFMPNLSIFDALFNLGPGARELIERG